MAIPISPIIDLVNSFICAFCSFQIFRSYQQDRTNGVLKYFSQAYLALVSAYIFLSLPRLIVPEQPDYLAIGFIFGQICFYLAVAYFAKVTTFFVDINWVH